MNHRSPSDRPNIIIMYADDLGFGDIGCYGAQSIPTPNLDRLAAEGLLFEQGYATAATCTPSRMSLLTGSYPYRNQNAAILPGDAPLIIEPGTTTLPSMLKNVGYKSAVVGKWHLGLGMGQIDWNGELDRIPLDVGFDESFIMAATNDRVPCVFVDGRRVANLDPDDPIEVKYTSEDPYPDLPSGKKNPELLRMMYSHDHNESIVNGVSRIGYMRGGEKALWRDEDMADVFLKRSLDFIDRHQNEPFFLYQAFHEPHVPRLPHERFLGKSGIGVRGDAIVEMDWCIGQTLDHLDALGLRENTIIIFSSDNGPILDDGYQDRAEELTGDHRPTGPLRGGKYSLFDGGTHVPMLLSWKGNVDAHSRTDAIVNHADFLASFAALTGQTLQEGDAPDSQNVLAALLGESTQGRETMILEGIFNTTLFRSGDWVYIPPHDGSEKVFMKNMESGFSAAEQLYNVKMDIGQVQNLAQKYPDKTTELAEELHRQYREPMTR